MSWRLCRPAIRKNKMFVERNLRGEVLIILKFSYGGDHEGNVAHSEESCHVHWDILNHEEAIVGRGGDHPDVCNETVGQQDAGKTNTTKK